MRKGIPSSWWVDILPRDPVDQLYPERSNTVARGDALFAVPRGTLAPPLRILETKNANEKREKKKKGKNKRKGNEKLDDRIGTRRNFCLSPTASPTLPIASLAILLARICNKGRQSREIRLIACSRDREPLPEGLLIAYLRLQSLVWPHKTPGVVSRTVEWIVDGEKYKK